MPAKNGLEFWVMTHWSHIRQMLQNVSRKQLQITTSSQICCVWSTKENIYVKPVKKLHASYSCSFIQNTRKLLQMHVLSLQDQTLFQLHFYGRPLSVAWAKSMLCFANVILFTFYGRLMLRPKLTEIRKTFTRGGPWVWIEKLLLGFFPGPP